MIEDRISGYLYNELFSESNEEKCTALQSMAWPLIVIEILLKTAQLLSKHFPSGLPLCILCFLFHFIYLFGFPGVITLSITYTEKLHCHRNITS